MTEFSLIPVWITTTFSAIGVIYAIVRNGSRAKKQDEKLKADLKSSLDTIKERLDDPDNGLSAIKKATEGMRLHCAETSTSISSQVKTNTSEIEKLRTRNR